MGMILEKKDSAMQLNDTNITVAVYMITYNHAEYIEQAVGSIINQRTNFTFKLYIGEDCSTDNTREICLRLKEKYSDKIELVLNAQNIGALQNAIKIFNLCFNSGAKYVAMLEGDDYWTDINKLQKQVNILENNPEVNICSHPSQRRYGDFVKKDNYGYWGDEVKIISAQQVIANYASTAPAQSIMFRNENIKELSLILSQLIGGHSTIQMFYALDGGLCYLPDYMSVYRVESSSSISKILFKNDKTYLERQIKNWKGLDLLNKYSNFKFEKEFQKSKRERALSVFYTGYLTIGQKFKLIMIYNLYREPLKLSKILKSDIYTNLGLAKRRILNFIKMTLQSH